ncbi:unnamed protein product [Amoebophrya sp. A25]|nr:unnamed protein product [Amoebophrya sp. A25]|eukprot:GSA25T00014075001.1
MMARACTPTTPAVVVRQLWSVSLVLVGRYFVTFTEGVPVSCSSCFEFVPSLRQARRASRQEVNIVVPSERPRDEVTLAEYSEPDHLGAPNMVNASCVMAPAARRDSNGPLVSRSRTESTTASLLSARSSSEDYYEDFMQHGGDSRNSLLRSRNSIDRPPGVDDEEHILTTRSGNRRQRSSSSSGHQSNILCGLASSSSSMNYIAPGGASPSTEVAQPPLLSLWPVERRNGNTGFSSSSATVARSSAHQMDVVDHQTQTSPDDEIPRQETRLPSRTRTLATTSDDITRGSPAFSAQHLQRTSSSENIASSVFPFLVRSSITSPSSSTLNRQETSPESNYSAPVLPAAGGQLHLPESRTSSTRSRIENEGEPLHSTNAPYDYADPDAQEERRMELEEKIVDDDKPQDSSYVYCPPPNAPVDYNPCVICLNSDDLVPQIPCVEMLPDSDLRRLMSRCAHFNHVHQDCLRALLFATSQQSETDENPAALIARCPLCREPLLEPDDASSASTAALGGPAAPGGDPVVRSRTPVVVDPRMLASQSQGESSSPGVARSLSRSNTVFLPTGPPTRSDRMSFFRSTQLCRLKSTLLQYGGLRPHFAFAPQNRQLDTDIPPNAFGASSSSSYRVARRNSAGRRITMGVTSRIAPQRE